MKCDIVCAGVGGQGVISVSSILADAAMREGLQVRQSEERGMSRRGGAVATHLRMSDEPIFSDLIPRATADILLGMEPLESLRYLAYLSPRGALVTTAEPTRNIPDYPELETVLSGIRRIPGARLVDTGQLARRAGSAAAGNMVLIGAASRLLPVTAETIESCIREAFDGKGRRTVEANLTGFRTGREVTA